jgi:hypothetical protein
MVEINGSVAFPHRNELPFDPLVHVKGIAVLHEKDHPAIVAGRTPLYPS